LWAFEPAPDDHDLNVPGDDLAGFGKPDAGTRTELPFELVCTIRRLPDSLSLVRVRGKLASKGYRRILLHEERGCFTFLQRSENYDPLFPPEVPF